MPERTPKPIVLPRMKGRWGEDDPLTCPDDQYIDAVNIDFWQSAIGRKRGGATALGMTAVDSAWGGVISTVAANLTIGSFPIIGVDDAGEFKFRSTVGTGWYDFPAPADAITGFYSQVVFAGLNGKMFVAYQSAVDRLHVLDIRPAVNTFRRVGIAAPSSAPTGADSGGAGTYAAVTRYYKVVFANIYSNQTLCRSEASSALTATPSGANASYTVTRPTAPGDSETHWWVYGSIDNSNYVKISGDIAVGTTTYVDSTAPSSYSGASLPVAGTWGVPPAVAYLLVDKAALVMAGNYFPMSIGGGGGGVSFGLRPSTYRIWWTGTFGSTDEGDDERISNTSAIKNYTDVEEPIYGMGGPVAGTIYVFSYRSAWRMTATSNPAARYLIYKADGVRGCIRHQTIVVAEDEFGAPAIYWLSPDGPTRMTQSGQQDMSEDIKDIWDTVNLGASIVGHGVYYSARKQIHWWIATGSSSSPDKKIVFDTRLGQATENGTVRKGWVVHTGEICEALSSCAAPYDNTVPRGPLVPFIARSSGTVVWRCDDGTDDAGTDFQAYALTKPYNPWGIGAVGGVNSNATLVASAQSGVSIQLELIKNFVSESNTRTVSLTPDSTETKVTRDFQDSRCAEADYIQLKLGDASAVDNTWSLDRLVVPVTYEGDV